MAEAAIRADQTARIVRGLKDAASSWPDDRRLIMAAADYVAAEFGAGNLVYEWSLWRTWDPSKPAVLFVMLNPSRADAEADDATIRKCIGFAKRWGYGTLLVWNLYAYRATDPAELDRAADPIGRANEDYLWPLMERADRIVVAWGAMPDRGKYVHRERVMFWGPFHDREVYALGTTQGGHPRHPVRLAYDTPLVRYTGPRL